MLVKKLKHVDYTMLSVPVEHKEKILKFAVENGFTLRSIVETMIEVFLDSWPIESKVTYDKKKVSDKINKHIGKLRLTPTLKVKRKTKTQKTK